MCFYARLQMATQTPIQTTLRKASHNGTDQHQKVRLILPNRSTSHMWKTTGTKPNSPANKWPYIWADLKCKAHVSLLTLLILWVWGLYIALQVLSFYNVSYHWYRPEIICLLHVCSNESTYIHVEQGERIDVCPLMEIVPSLAISGLLHPKGGWWDWGQGSHVLI